MNEENTKTAVLHTRIKNEENAGFDQWNGKLNLPSAQT
jgi:hypothetical protein